jgi:RNA polymerase sigma factor (TIGR02999 family)
MTVPDLDQLLRPLPPDQPPSEALVAALYDELRGIAHRQLRGERPDHTLTTTALVHEAYLKLSRSTNLPDGSHGAFLAAAANTMRRVLVDYARTRNAKKREGAKRAVELTAAVEMVAEEGDQLLALDEALTRLQDSSPRLVRLVECRFFIGLSEAETAAVMGASVRTVRRDWVKAKGWLAAALADR